MGRTASASLLALQEAELGTAIKTWLPSCGKKLSLLSLFIEGKNGKWEQEFKLYVILRSYLFALALPTQSYTFDGERQPFEDFFL